METDRSSSFSGYFVLNPSVPQAVLGVSRTDVALRTARQLMNSFQFCVAEQKTSNFQEYHGPEHGTQRRLALILSSVGVRVRYLRHRWECKDQKAWRSRRTSAEKPDVQNINDSRQLRSYHMSQLGFRNTAKPDRSIARISYKTFIYIVSGYRNSPQPARVLFLPAQSAASARSVIGHADHHQATRVRLGRRPRVPPRLCRVKSALPGNLSVIDLNQWHVPILPVGGQAPTPTTQVAIVDAI